MRGADAFRQTHRLCACGRPIRLRSSIIAKTTTQGELFDVNEAYRHTLIASNRRESAAQTFEWHCQRGECSENWLKELKIGFGMERLPCGQFAANAMFFRLGVLAYNLFLLFKQSALSSE